MGGVAVERHRRRLLCGFVSAVLVLAPVPAFAMHIAEGIITGWPVLAYTIGGVLLMAIGTQGIKTFQRKFPDRKPLIGMGAASSSSYPLFPFPHLLAPRRTPAGHLWLRSSWDRG